MIRNVDSRNNGTDDVFVVELDERLEFGAAIIDSDLQADDNTGCHNVDNCGKSLGSNTSCVNDNHC